MYKALSLRFDLSKAVLPSFPK